MKITKLFFQSYTHDPFKITKNLCAFNHRMDFKIVEGFVSWQTFVTFQHLKNDFNFYKIFIMKKMGPKFSKFPQMFFLQLLRFL